MKYIILIFLGLMAVSCNKAKIEDLEHQVTILQRENKALKSHIEELNDEISRLNRHHNPQPYYSKQKETELELQRQFHQQNAQQHLRDAEFWRQEGNQFQYESSMRMAQQELDMIK